MDLDSTTSASARFSVSVEEQGTAAIYSRVILDAKASRVRGLLETIAEGGGGGSGSGGGGSDWRREPGKPYYVNVKTGERAFELGDGEQVEDSVSGAGGGGGSGGLAELAKTLPDSKAADFVSVADAYGHAARLARSEVRNASGTIELRRASNFVKDGPIRTTIAFWIHTLRKQHMRPSINVMDFCCGRGQDFDKYRRAARDSSGSIDKLVGIDIAGGEAAASARERWSQCSQMQISTTEIQYSFRSVMMGGTLVGDLSRAHAGITIPTLAQAAGWETDSYPEICSFHIVSCMFAMHYFFKDEQSFRNLVLGAGWYLREGGFFIMVHADGESIAAHHTASESGRPIRIGQATIQFHPHTLRMLEGEPFSDRRAFGWSYDFHLPQAVENVTEYLVHSPTRDRIMEEYHLVKVFDEAADVTMLSMLGVPFWHEAFVKSEVDCNGSGRCSEETLDHLSIYRVVVYTKSPLKVDIHTVRKFIRSKMGLGE